MCVSELMLALGQADLCGRFTYGKPWLMRSLSTQLDLALLRMMRLVGRQTSSEEANESAHELAQRLWPHRSAEQVRDAVVDAKYNLASCKALARLLAEAPSRLLPGNDELQLQAEEVGVTCCLGASFGDRIATLLAGRVMPGLLHDAVLVGPCCGCVALQAEGPTQPAASSFPPWRTPPSTWADNDCPHNATGDTLVRIGLPRFSKAGHGTL